MLSLEEIFSEKQAICMVIKCLPTDCLLVAGAGAGGGGKCNYSEEKSETTFNLVNVISLSVIWKVMDHKCLWI